MSDCKRCKRSNCMKCVRCNKNCLYGKDKIPDDSILKDMCLDCFIAHMIPLIDDENAKRILKCIIV